jgi:ABC-type branched-subunit amino acid transport system ATPase component
MQLLARVGLDDRAALPANEHSHGDQRSLELAIALALQAKLILLDEPAAGLSPADTRLAMQLIQSFALEEGMTIVFIEHDMAVVFDIADWITVLDRGRILADGPPALVRANSDVQHAYLGELETAL